MYQHGEGTPNPTPHTHTTHHTTWKHGCRRGVLMQVLATIVGAFLRKALKEDVRRTAGSEAQRGGVKYQGVRRHLA
ncbi:hypothetical protein E2C01_073304 [Portunus trituberculatus]|uniref:Uncharacterized protein n=1 Tax=Portunus trituberculatus TaxID=210409 RepID=A0A5B7IA83_PORTR|nr:hypothetical protein [Portunus trituberculatus]